MGRWYDKPVDDLRWDDLCTKEATGQCAMCDALAERDRFERFWFQGGLFIDGIPSNGGSGCIHSPIWRSVIRMWCGKFISSTRKR